MKLHICSGPIVQKITPKMRKLLYLEEEEEPCASSHLRSLPSGGAPVADESAARGRVEVAGAGGLVGVISPPPPPPPPTDFRVALGRFRAVADLKKSSENIHERLERRGLTYIQTTLDYS